MRDSPRGFKTQMPERTREKAGDQGEVGAKLPQGPEEQLRLLVAPALGLRMEQRAQHKTSLGL